MEHSGLLLFLVPFILFCDFQEHELAEGSFDGKCPKKRVTCEYHEINQCKKHEDCRDNKKICCKYSCGLKCIRVGVDFCTLPRVIGHCRGRIPRWWYRATDNKCERFNYGGCFGNENNFQTEQMCLQACEKKPKKKPWYQFWKLEDLQDLKNVSQSRALSMNS